MLGRSADDVKGVKTFLDEGIAALDRDRLGEALLAYREALRLAPTRAEVYVCIAHVFHLLAEFDAEIAMLESAIALQPDYANAHCNLGVTLLLRGEFHRGWNEFVQYLRLPERRKAMSDPYLDRVPLWDGTPFRAGRLVISRDQGLGDFVQMMRYFPMVKARGGEVVVDAAQPVARLAQGYAGIDEVRVVRDVERPRKDVDLHVPLMCLPHMFGTDLTSIPSTVPYLSADPALMRRWAPRLAGDQCIRVGIAWAGNAVHHDDRRRSCRLEDLAPLGTIDGVAWFSLQKGRDEREAACTDLRLTRLGPEIEDCADVAAVVALLDLVITVDTAVAHIAGALGKPVWVLLPFVPDWRWMLEREDTPWYPTMRLFRQGSDRGWAPVIERVLADLRPLGKGLRDDG